VKTSSQRPNVASIILSSIHQEGYSFLGLVTLRDPPKPSVPPAIAALRHAGIRVFMVTGDHHLTGAAIARQVGIIGAESVTNYDVMAAHKCSMDDVFEDHYEEFGAVVATGSEIEHFNEKRWEDVLKKGEVVFARTSPEQKLAIVSHAQKMGNIVAVTGDGVNDSPALKKADIGVAMGLSGSDVSRDAAHVILMKDDFAAIVKGVKEGRTIFDNITKTIGYTITHMLPEVSAVLMNLAFGFPLGLNAILILALDLGTELAPSVSLAYEVGESDVMDRAPRNAHSDRLVTGKLTAYFVLQAGLIETLFCMIGYFAVFSYHGIGGSCLYLADTHFITDSPDFVCNGLTFTNAQQLNILAQAQSLYWVMIVFTQLFHIFICKARIASLFDHGFFQNHSMNTGTFLSLAF
jgi:sodium/potassium-transporting ATPase subunit alpha